MIVRRNLDPNQYRRRIQRECRVQSGVQTGLTDRLDLLLQVSSLSKICWSSLTLSDGCGLDRLLSLSAWKHTARHLPPPSLSLSDSQARSPTHSFHFLPFFLSLFRSYFLKKTLSFFSFICDVISVLSFFLRRLAVEHLLLSDNPTMITASTMNCLTSDRSDHLKKKYFFRQRCSHGVNNRFKSSDHQSVEEYLNRTTASRGIKFQNKTLKYELQMLCLTGYEKENWVIKKRN